MSDWENQEKLQDQVSITYNEAGKTYNEINFQYNGKERANWTEQTKN